MSDPLIFLGVDWTDPVTPQLRVAPLRRGAPAQPLPYDQAWSYRAVADQPRRCTGYFDLAVTPPAHVTCQDLRVVARGVQCPTCRHREGFTGAHTTHRDGGPAAAMPDHVRQYLAQPHQLYLDVFADGTSKVGTAAQSRLHSRLAEQGPVAAVYIARGADGAVTRHAEALVADGFVALTKAVTTRRKLASLQQSPVDAEPLRRDLDQLAENVTTYLRAHTPDLEILAPPQPWQPPTASSAVFLAAPLPPYPRDLSAGEHHIALAGLAGSIAALAPAPNHPPTHLADLNQLRGRTIVRREYRPLLTAATSSTIAAASTQAALW